MSDTSLMSVLENLTREGSGVSAQIPDTWKQGRTTYGGLITSLLLATTLRNHTDLPPLRSAMINFIAPVSDTPVMTSRVLRQGRNVTAIEAVAMIGDQIVCQAQFVFGVAQDSAIDLANAGPDTAAPETYDLLIPEQFQSLAPKFQQNFEVRLIEGGRPLSGSTRAYLRAWIRHRDPSAHTGVLALMCLADGLPPAVFPMFPKLGPNSSVNWMCNFLSETPETEDGWWQMETSAERAQNGYSSQVMRMWNSRGELVVEGMQSVLVFV
ncbi:MAG: thioesterase family protein [Sedimentitalea sp.]